MVKRFSVAEATDDFSRVLHDAEAGATVELTRRGLVVAVLLPRAQYELSVPKPPMFWGRFEQFRRDFDLSQIGIEPEVWEGVRDRSPGREFSW